MKGLRVFLATFAITLTIGALAQDSVIPSKLRVQSIGVNTPAPASGKVVIRRNAANDVFSTCRSNATVGQQCVAHTISLIGSYLIYGGNDSGVHTGNEIFNATRSGPGSWSNLKFGNATDNPTYTFAGTGAISGNGSGLTSLSAANISSGTLPVARGGTGVTSSTGSGSVVLSNSPALTSPTVGGQQVCLANGTNCPAQPRMAYARINGTAQCANIGGANSGVVLPCNRTAAGSYTVDLSPAFAAVPVCTVSQHSNSARIMQALPVSASQVYVRARDITGTLTDGDFSIICIGT